MWMELFCEVKLFSENSSIDKIKNQLSFIFSVLNELLSYRLKKQSEKVKWKKCRVLIMVTGCKQPILHCYIPVILQNLVPVNSALQYVSVFELFFHFFVVY